MQGGYYAPYQVGYNNYTGYAATPPQGQYPPQGQAPPQNPKRGRKSKAAKGQQEGQAGSQSGSAGPSSTAPAAAQPDQAGQEASTSGGEAGADASAASSAPAGKSSLSPLAREFQPVPSPPGPALSLVRASTANSPAWWTAQHLSCLWSSVQACTAVRHCGPNCRGSHSSTDLTILLQAHPSGVRQPHIRIASLNTPACHCSSHVIRWPQLTQQHRSSPCMTCS